MWITQPQLWLGSSRRLLLIDDVGYVVSAKGTRCRCFLNGASNTFRSILPDQFEQLRDLPAERTIRICHIAQVSFHQRTRAQAIERIQQSLLRLRTPCGRPLLGQ